MSSVLGVWGVLSQKMTEEGVVVLIKMTDDNDRAKDNNRKTM